MSTNLNQISVDLFNNYAWEKVEHRFVPVLSNDLSSNLRIYDEFVCKTKEEAIEKAKEMIDEGWKAGNDFPARDISFVYYQITATDCKRVSGFTEWTIYK